MTSNSVEVVICRACVVECKEYKSLYKQGLIMGEVTTLASLLTFCTNLDFLEQEYTKLPAFICTKCVQDLVKSFVFKKKVLEANQILNSHVENVDDTVDGEHTKEKASIVIDDSETDLQELAEAAQMKRELERQMYDNTEEYVQLTNEDEEQQHHNIDGNPIHEHEEEEEIEMEYVVHDVAETTEIYHTTVITQEETRHIHIEEPEEIEHVEQGDDEQGDDEQGDDEQGDDEEDEGEVEYEIHVNDIEEDYTELITDSQDGTSQHSFKRPSEDTTNSESENGSANPFVKRFKRSAQTSKTPNPDYQCKVCGKQLSNASSFKYHLQLHSDETPFKCNVCGEAFKTRNAYDGHISIHDPNNPNTCELCGKSYRQASSLRMHMLTHTGEKPFTCDICGKSLTQKSGFKKHMLTHTGEKPYTCDICGKAFRISSNMLAHRRCHTGERQFQCSECDKAFNSADQLKRHVMVHSDEKPFSCDYCGKQFKRQSAMRSHVNLTHEALPNRDHAHEEINRAKSNTIEEVYEPAYEDEKPNRKSNVVEIY